MDFGPKLFPIFSHGNRADVRVGQLEKLEGLRTGLDGGSGGSPELTPPPLAVFVLKALGFSLDTSARNINGLKLVSREVCAADKSSRHATRSRGRGKLAFQPPLCAAASSDEAEWTRRA